MISNLLLHIVQNERISLKVAAKIAGVNESLLNILVLTCAGYYNSDNINLHIRSESFGYFTKGEHLGI